MKKLIFTAVAVVAVLALAFGIWVDVQLYRRDGTPSEEYFNPFEAYEKSPLSVSKTVGSDFKILQFTDTHLTGLFANRDAKSVYKIMEKLINENAPDLIVITGDVTVGKISWQNALRIRDFLDGFKVPYAPVFGNHDIEGNAHTLYLADIYMNGEYCLFKKSPADVDGVSNYVINIEEDGKIVYALTMLDSHSSRRFTAAEKATNPLGGANYDYIKPSQLVWYEYHIKGLETLAGTTVPSLAFFHIPLPEYRLFDTQTADFGESREEVCNSWVNSGLFSKMVELGSTKGVFVGHEHVNNFSFMLDGIRLSYGLKTGTGSYSDSDMQGGTLITIADDGGLTVEHKYA